MVIDNILAPILDISTDIWIACLPLPLLRHLNIPKRSKNALMAVFALGGFTCVVCTFSGTKCCILLAGVRCLSFDSRASTALHTLSAAQRSRRNGCTLERGRDEHGDRLLVLSNATHSRPEGHAQIPHLLHSDCIRWPPKLYGLPPKPLE